MEDYAHSLNIVETNKQNKKMYIYHFV